MCFKIFSTILLLKTIPWLLLNLIGRQMIDPSDPNVSTISSGRGQMLAVIIGFLLWNRILLILLLLDQTCHVTALLRIPK